MHKMKDSSRLNTAAYLLILINALFWLIFALFAALGALPASLSSGPLRWGFIFLALCTSFSLVFLVFLLNSRKKAAYYLIMFELTLISILSVTDEVGFLDFFILVVSAAAIVILFLNRSWYLNSSNTQLGD
jgi:hypothetical protein